jgi:hypothetical protein
MEARANPATSAKKHPMSIATIANDPFANPASSELAAGRVPRRPVDGRVDNLWKTAIPVGCSDLCSCLIS